MESMLSYVCCPVCSLYLREGVSLQEHLNTHPKEQVIDALVRYSGVYSTDGPSKQYQEFVNAFPRVAATMVYPMYGQGGAPVASLAEVDPLSTRPPPTPFETVLVDPPNCKCGPSCVSNCHYVSLKEEVTVDSMYDKGEVSWTPEAASASAPEPEEPTNLCLRYVHT